MLKHNRIKLILIAISGAALTLSACTKDRPFKSLYKEEVLSKSETLDPNAEYLYAASIVSSPRSVSATIPNWLGSEKIVKVRLTEKALEIYEPEADSRFDDNESNNRVVLTVPVQHIDYRCRKNAAEECSNEEEEVNDVAWNQKSMFKPDFSGLSVKEVTVTPMEIDNLFKGCHTEIGSKLVSHELKKDTINVEIERIFKASVQCVDSLESVSDLTFTVRYHYSFAKLDQMSSAGYEAIEYPQRDENTFGFFTTEQHRLSVDNRPEEDGETVYLNRWNPKRKVIQYHLSDEFAKPEHAAVLKSTHKAVAAINQALEKSSSGLQVQLNAPSGKNPGDIRNAMIVMVEDPQATGILGYGPSIANPRTGEIVGARTVMFLGTIKKYIRMAYDDFVEESRAEALAKKPLALLLQQFRQGVFQ